MVLKISNGLVMLFFLFKSINAKTKPAEGICFKLRIIRESVLSAAKSAYATNIFEK